MRYKCIVCNEQQHELIHRVPDRHYLNPGVFNIIKCKNCDLASINPMLNEKDLSKYYPDDNYYAYEYTKKSFRLKKIIKFLFLRSMIPNEAKFDRPGKILDYGCGSGWELYNFKNKGWQVLGCEPNNKAALFGENQFGVKILNGTFYTVNIKSNQFDYVRSYHSLEHDPYAKQTVENFHRVLKKGGKLLIGVPNYDSIQRKIFNNYWWYLGAPVHTYNFSVKNLSDLVRQSGLKIKSVRYVSNYQGLLGSLAFYLNKNKSQVLSSDLKLLKNPVLIIFFQFLATISNILKIGDSIEIIAEK